MGRTAVLFLCAAVPLTGIALAVKYGPRDVSTTSHAIRSAPHRSVAANGSHATATPDVPAPRANGVAITLPDLPSLRVGIDEDAALRKKLAQVVDLDLTDVPLDAALERLSEVAGVRILPDWKVLAEEGIGPNEKFTFRGKKRRLGDALRSGLEPLNLTWIVRRHVVRVTTEECADNFQTARFYDLRRIKAVLRRHMRGPLPPQTVPVRHRLMGYTGPFPPDVDLNRPMRTADPVPVPDDRIVALLIDHTNASWFGADPFAGGAATPFGDLLLVRQTEWAHEQIDALLAGLQLALEGRLDHGSLPLSPRDRAIDAAVHAKLDEAIDIDFRAIPLNRALASIEERLGVRVRLDEPHLRDEGILVDAPVTAGPIGLPARVALWHVLEPLALAAIVKDGELFVTSEIKAHDYLVSTIYDVRDIADRLRGDELLDLLSDGTSGPWQESDGVDDRFADIPVPGILVVRQSQRVHEEIRRLLANLRVALAGHPPRMRPAPHAGDATVEMSWQTYPFREPATGEERLPNVHDIERRVRKEVDPESWYHYGGQARIYVDSKVDRYDLAVLQTASAHAKIDRLLKRLTGATPKRTESDEK